MIITIITFIIYIVYAIIYKSKLVNLPIFQLLSYLFNHLFLFPLLVLFSRILEVF